VATILTFPTKKSIPVWGLTPEECDTIHTLAYDLIRQGKATGVSIHNDGQYMCVFDGRGEPYFIGRVDSDCYLFNANETLIAENRRFEIVLDALRDTLIQPTGLPA
jgi:hypothetical protein